MLQGFYSAASGMFMQQRHLNVLANNLANTQTPGYKTNRLVSTTFEQTLLARLERGNSAYLGGVGSPARIVDEVADIFTVVAPGAVLWTRQFGTNSADFATGVAADAHGGAFVAGSTDGALVGSSAGDGDVFVRAYGP